VPRVVLVSGHYLRSKRKAGFHWLADAWHRAGWDVTFATVGLSWISVLARNHRLAYPVRAEAGRLLEVAPGLRSFVWFTRWHPVALRPRWLDRLAAPFWRRYGRLPLGALEGPVREADCLVFESAVGLFCVDAMRALNPRARFVYRVSDDLAYLGAPAALLACERRVAASFDLVSIPSPAMAPRLAAVCAPVHHPHGVRTELLDVPTPDPYGAAPRPRAVFVGVDRLDTDFLARAARLCPDWSFHVIGPRERLRPPAAPNVTAYGELPFEATVPYLQHADVGLHARRADPGAEVFADSLKVQQFTWCRLPVVAPRALCRGGRPHVFGYDPGDDASIRAALQAARACDRAAIDRSGVWPWERLAAALAGPLWAAAPGTIPAC
jgi:2-beta-glucuronyltransferase